MKPLKEKTTASENDSLVDRVEKHIIEYIKENALKAGDALPKELEFAETLGVSRTAIREAMNFRLGRISQAQRDGHSGA